MFFGREKELETLNKRYKNNQLQKYIPTYSNTDKVIIYAIFGGIPAYLRFINSKKNLQTNIINNFFDKDNVIYDEPNNLLKEELREPAVYNSIITAIATGSSKLNEIATKTGIEKSKSWNGCFK